MKWKIYYSNSTYSEEDGPPELAPKQDVQVIVVKDDVVGRYIERSNDYYIWTPNNGGWRGVDMFGLFDYLSEPGLKIVLFGRTLHNDEFRKVWSKASKDVEFPPKSAFLPNERKP